MKHSNVKHNQRLPSIAILLLHAPTQTFFHDFPEPRETKGNSCFREPAAALWQGCEHPPDRRGFPSAKPGPMTQLLLLLAGMVSQNK